MDDNGMYGIMQDESDGGQKNSIKKMKTVGNFALEPQTMRCCATTMGPISMPGGLRFCRLTLI